MMDARQLRHFVAVAETLHFGRAATRLGMTQPPLSQSIIALERTLGAPLFERTKRSVALTALGKHWLDPVRAALAGLDDLPGLAARLRDGVAGRLALSFISTADYSILPGLVRAYAGRFPDVEITLTEATSDVQIAQLLEGGGDAGIIIPPSAGLPTALNYRRLLLEPLIVAAPEGWIDEGRLDLVEGRIPAAVVTGAPAISFPARIAPAFHDIVVRFQAAHGGRPRVAQEAIQMQTIISLVSAGMGLALVPASLRHLARTGVRYLDLVEQPPLLETGLAWRSSDRTPTLLRFLDMALAADIAM
jgi:DNA-binding transcriptional LysR family regulator